MNIKHAPCMARIVAPGHDMSGWIVQVAYAAPKGPFELPDGYPSHGDHGLESWVCESLMHSPFKAQLANGRCRLTRYAVIGDKHLRPLPGVSEAETVETSTTKELEMA